MTRAVTDTTAPSAVDSAARVAPPPARLGALRDAVTGARMAARFALELPQYLRGRLGAAEAAAIVRARHAEREANFLRLVREGIYAHRRSPYRILLEAIGCTEHDIVGLVRTEGLDGALARLEQDGVYLTVDEFRGRSAIVRGSTRIAPEDVDCRNPLTAEHVRSWTGGSGGSALAVHLDLNCVRDRAVNMQLALCARGGEHWHKAVWSLRGLVPVLWYSAMPPRDVRWFTQMDPASRGWRSRFGWSARLLAWEGRLLGLPVPRPEYAPLEAPDALLRWIGDTKRAGGVPHVWTTPSAAVQLAETARERQVSLVGTECTITGEPVTAARLGSIADAGMRAVPDYGSVESGGTIAYGCLAPASPDDVHVWDDLNAVNRAGTPAFPPDTLLVTSLMASAPFILLNVSMGDRAVLGSRACGCPMEALGWRTHLTRIASFEKVTARGAAFDDASVIAILEDELPRRLGGGPTDYQLVEEAGDRGRPRVRLIVSPRVGPLDLEAARDAFLEALGRSTEVERDMVAQWRDTGTLEVVREQPRATSAGKILHLVSDDADPPR